MFNPEKLIHEYNKLANGKSKLAGIKLAIIEADNNEDYDWSLYFREEYIQESVFEDDNFNAIVMFPEYMALYDAHPEYHSNHKHTFMIRFKWIIENLKDFYQVTKEQADMYFNEFQKRCKEYGYSSRMYFMKRTEFYKFCDENIAKEDFKHYKKSRRDSISDCHACDINKELEFELAFGNIENALKIAKPILNGSVSCAEVPHVTYGALMSTFTKLGEFEEATHYSNLMYSLVVDNINFMKQIGDLLTLCSVTNTSRGFDIFVKHSSWIVSSKNPMCNLHFSIGAYRLFKAILNDGVSQITIKNIPKKLSFYNSSNIYDVQTLVDYFYNYAKGLAIKFDNRNGTSYFMDLLDFEYKPSEDAIKLPNHLYLLEKSTSLISAPIRDMIDFSNLQDAFIKNLKDMQVKKSQIEVNENNLSINVNVEYLGNTYSLILAIVDKELPDEDVSFKHNVLKKDFQSFNDMKYSLICVTTFQDKFEVCYHLQIKVLCALGLDIPFIYDISRNTIMSYKWAELCAYSRIPPNIEYLVNINVISDEESDTVWLYTSGLSCCGLRELEIIGAKKEFLDNYYQILLFTIENIIYYDNLDDEFEILNRIYDNSTHTEVFVTWRLTEDILPDVPKNIFGSIEKRYDYINDTACINIYPTRRSRKPRTMWELSDDFIRNIYCSYTYIREELDTQLAIERIPFIKKLIESDLDCSIKVNLELESDFFNDDIDEFDEDDEYNYYDDDYAIVTINLEGFEDNQVIGSLAHDLEEYNYQVGDTIRADIYSVCNWLISFSDGIDVNPDSIYMIL